MLFSMTGVINAKGSGIVNEEVQYWETVPQVRFMGGLYQAGTLSGFLVIFEAETQAEMESYVWKSPLWLQDGYDLGFAYEARPTDASNLYPTVQAAS